ncbi:HtaA domain-containing protein, partial [Microbacterium sp.]
PGDGSPGDGEPGDGEPGDGEPGVTTPSVSVSKTTDLARDGETITVTGTGFVPDPPSTDGTRPPLAGSFGGAYVVFGKFADEWKPSEGAPGSTRTVITQRWGVAEADFGGAVNAGNGGFPIAADGSFSMDILVSASEADDLLRGNYGIYTYPGSGATHAPFETFTPLSFEPAPAPEPVYEPVLAVFADDGITPIGDTPLKAGDTIVVKGSGYDPGANVGGRGVPIPNTLPQGTYVVFGSFADVWQPSAGAPSSSRAVGAQKWALAASVLDQVPPQYQGAIRAQWVELAPDGTFTAELTLEDVVPPASGGTYGVYTYGAGGVVNAAQEQSVALDYASAPQLSTTVTDASADGLTVRAQGAGFAGVTGAYGAIIEKGTEDGVTSGGGYVAFGYWAIPGIFVDGAFDQTVVAPADALDPTRQYELIVWRTHTNPTAETILARADIAVTEAQWAAVTGAAGPTDPGSEPGTEPGTTPGTPSTPVTVPGGSLRWAISSSFASYVVGGIAKGSISVGGGATRANGLFQFGQVGGSTYNPSTGTGTVGYAGSVRFTGHGGALDVTVANPQVRITSATRAALYVTSGGSRVHFANLDLAAAKRTSAGGAVTYTGAPASLTSAGLSQVLAGYDTTLNPVTFTIGSPASAPSGRSGTVAAAAAMKTTQIPPAPPATAGIELDAATLAALEAGESVTVSASGFTANEQGIKVVVYSTPVLLGTVAADASGTATWTGSLPATLADGAHTLTFQGSVDLGIPFTLARATTAAGQCSVEGATLRWGYKESFRSYVEGIAHGGWELDGIVYEFPEYVWSDGSGSVDPETGAGLVEFGGALRFTGHEGTLDTTLRNARIELAGSTGYIVFDIDGETQDGASVDATDVRFAEFAVPAAVDGVIAIDGAPATLTDSGAAAFGTYPAGEEFDPVTATIPVSGDCAIAPAAVAEGGEAAAAGAAVTPISAQEAPLWPWIVGGGVLLLVAAGVTVMVISRRRQGTSA